MDKQYNEKVGGVVQNLLKVLEDQDNYLFLDPAIENEVEEILNKIIIGYLGECSCEEHCTCSVPNVSVSYGVLQKILLMLVQAKIEALDLSEFLSEMEEADINP
ncbi:MAG: hypothetical protein GF334_03995 [Candidatus Altiarchaeales archaeon]|nr:hypothetical protein [Candidatus Altiarchaeales archaeon]